MNLFYQFIALIIWILFISWITDDADAKRYKYKQRHRHTKIEKRLSTAITGLAIIKGFSKPIKYVPSHNND